VEGSPIGASCGAWGNKVAICPPATGPGSLGAGRAGEEASSVRRGSDSEGRPQDSTSHQEESDASFAGLSTVDTKYDFN